MLVCGIRGSFVYLYIINYIHTCVLYVYHCLHRYGYNGPNQCITQCNVLYFIFFVIIKYISLKQMYQSVYQSIQSIYFDLSVWCLSMCLSVFLFVCLFILYFRVYVLTLTNCMFYECLLFCVRFSGSDIEWVWCSLRATEGKKRNKQMSGYWLCLNTSTKLVHKWHSRQTSIHFIDNISVMLMSYTDVMLGNWSRVNLSRLL